MPLGSVAIATVLFTSVSLRIWNRPLVSTVTLLEARLLNQSDRGAICQCARLRVADDDSSHLCQRSQLSLALCQSAMEEKAQAAMAAPRKHQVDKEGRRWSVEPASLARSSSIILPPV